MAEAGSGLEAEEVRQELYDIMRQDVGFQRKASRALALGMEYLGVQNGHLTRVDPATNYWEAIESTDPPDGTFPAGLTLDLDATYCRKTINRDVPVAVHDAPEQGWAEDPAFEAHELHTYHGVCVTARQEIYGTVCFVSEAPRDEPFTDDESMFVELIARLLGHEIEHERHEIELVEREQMVDVLCRVLRHNLRNRLNVVRGHAELLSRASASDADASAETIVSAIDEMVALSERTRELSDLVNREFVRQDYDIEATVRDIAADIVDDHPDATVSIEGTTDTQLRASEQLPTALRELLDNAARHGGAEPRIAVALAGTQEAIEIEVADTGPGLADHGRRVIESGVVTPLEHGTGLGLWLVYWIVTRHDGSIDTSVTDTGTTVTIRLPHGPVKFRSEEDSSVGSEA